MVYRTLGSSGLRVSPICLGTMTFGRPVAEADAIRLVHAAIDHGINFIDTANVYEGYDRVIGSAGGVAELILGKALHDRREQVVLATKVGSPIGPGPLDRGLSASHALRELDNSLRRLQTDYIDLYIPHWPDPVTPAETWLATMDLAVKQGKVRYLGVSNHAAWQICELRWLAERSGWPRVMSSQLPFGLLQREFQSDLVFCAEHGVGVTPFWTLQGGLLTGKYRRGQPPPPDSRVAQKPEWTWKLDEALFDRLERVEALAREAGVSMTRYALAWALAQPAVTSLIVGFKRIEQMEEALGAVDVRIPAEHFSKLDGICPPPWQPEKPVRT